MLDVSDADAENLMLGLLSAVPGMLCDDLASTFFPDAGPFARSKYPMHMEAIRGTALNDVYSVFGGNRTGKTTLLAYIASRWATGVYPDWWDGRRFDKPTVGWICSVTSSTVIRALQRYLIGSDGQGGLIPRELIVDVDYDQVGMARLIKVRHVPTGMISEIYSKTYDMHWKRYQSDTIDWGILDEEAPAKIYDELLTRSATTNGITLLGFTALDGVTPLVAHLLPQYAGVPEADDDEEPAARGHVFIGWDDIPYAQLSKRKREQLAKSYLPQERQARMKGIPTIGTGLVYPCAEEQFVVQIEEAERAWGGPAPPRSWPRIMALDPGGTPGGDGRTAALVCAYEAEADRIWAYAEYYARFAPIPTHVLALARFSRPATRPWIPIIIDPAGADITDGKGVYAEYVEAIQAINESWAMCRADKRFSLGRAELYDRLITERFRVLATCRNFLAEHRQYVINSQYKFVGTHHLLDCARYIARNPTAAALPPASTLADRPIHQTDYFR